MPIIDITDKANAELKARRVATEAREVLARAVQCYEVAVRCATHGQHHQQRRHQNDNYRRTYMGHPAA